ncbi:hypothetical protein AB4Y64_00830 [Lysobacter sp. TAF61]|uniref:hypothetical protein n=1 Tax=Lysobacter sp. TAF61 TaxID=3233072 RepID=UPI003F9E8005
MTHALRRVAAVALVLLPVVAVAAVPTDGQVARVQQLLGFDEAFALTMDEKFERAPELSHYSSTERTCVSGLVRPAFAGALNDAFRNLFGDGAVVEDWERFAQTPGGARFMEFVRSGVVATARNQPRPEPEAFMRGMTPEQFDEVSKFLASPAAAVLKREFPEMDLPQEQQSILAAKVHSQCGVELPKA